MGSSAGFWRSGRRAMVVGLMAVALLSACTPTSTGPTVPWEALPVSCTITGQHVVSSPAQLPYGCQLYPSVTCLTSGPTSLMTPTGVVSWTSDGGTGTEAPPRPLWAAHNSSTAEIPDDGVPADAVDAAVDGLGLVQGDSYTEFRSVGYTSTFACEYGDGQWKTSPSTRYLVSYRTPSSLQCQKQTIFTIGPNPLPVWGIGDPYPCDASGRASAGTTPPAPVLVGAGYWGPAYVCAPAGTTATFLGASRNLPYGYPYSGGGDMFRQVSPAPGALYMWEGGLPLTVPYGTLCDARVPGRVTASLYGDATPVPNAWTGYGFVCNPSGTKGVLDSASVTIPAGTGGAVGFVWAVDKVTFTYQGQAWVAPRADVCPSTL